MSVVGFPFSLTQGEAFAIWSTGFVATDIDLNFDNRPCFLIDSRTRSGQSGSPVFAKRNLSFVQTDGDLTMGAPRTEVVGVYTGRVRKDSDLGYVWKLKVILDLLEKLD